MGGAMRTSRIVALGDPIGGGGQKYRIREVIGDHAFYLAECPKRNPTHRVSFHQTPIWDGYAGVWRLSNSYSLTPFRRNRPRAYA